MSTTVLSDKYKIFQGRLGSVELETGMDGWMDASYLCNDHLNPYNEHP